MITRTIFTALSSLLLMGNVQASTTQEPPTSEMSPGEGMERCYGIAKVGMNDCGSKTHSCSGESKINGDKTSWLAVPTGLCKRIVGGSLTSGEGK